METINQKFEEKFSFANMEVAGEETSFVIGAVKKFLLRKESFLHLFKFFDEEGFIKGITTDNWHIKISAAGIVFELNRDKTEIDINFGRVSFYFDMECNCYALTNYQQTIYFLELDSEEDALKAFCLFFDECVSTLNNGLHNPNTEYDIIEEFDDMFGDVLRYGLNRNSCHMTTHLL